MVIKTLKRVAAALTLAYLISGASGCSNLERVKTQQEYEASVRYAQEQDRQFANNMAPFVSGVAGALVPVPRNTQEALLQGSARGFGEYARNQAIRESKTSNQTYDSSVTQTPIFQETRLPEYDLVGLNKSLEYGSSTGLREIIVHQGFNPYSNEPSNPIARFNNPSPNVSVDPSTGTANIDITVTFGTPYKPNLLFKKTQLPKARNLAYSVMDSRGNLVASDSRQYQLADRKNVTMTESVSGLLPGDYTITFNLDLDTNDDKPGQSMSSRLRVR